MVHQCLVEPLGLQKPEIGDGILRARQDDEAGAGEGGRAPGVHDADPRFRFQGGKVGEVGDVGKPDHGDRNSPGLPAAIALDLLQGDAVLFGQMEPREHRHDAQHPATGLPLEEFDGRGQERGVAPELVKDEAPDPSTIGRPQEPERPQQASEDAAPVDVPDEENGSAGQARHRHVGDVPIHQVGLGRIAGALDQDEVGLGGEPLVAFPDGGPEPPGHRVVVLGTGHSHDLSQHDHLAPLIRLGLEEDRIHLDPRLDPRRLGLHGLGPSHLAAVPSHIGVERHVLRLEGDDPQPFPEKQAAQSRNDEALARVGRRSLDHQRPRHRRHLPRAATTSPTATERPLAKSITATARWMCRAVGSGPLPSR